MSEEAKPIRSGSGSQTEDEGDQTELGELIPTTSTCPIAAASTSLSIKRQKKKEKKKSKQVMKREAAKREKIFNALAVEHLKKRNEENTRQMAAVAAALARPMPVVEKNEENMEMTEQVAVRSIPEEKKEDEKEEVPDSWEDRDDQEYQEEDHEKEQEDQGEDLKEEDDEEDDQEDQEDYQEEDLNEEEKQEEESSLSSSEYITPPEFPKTEEKKQEPVLQPEPEPEQIEVVNCAVDEVDGYMRSSPSNFVTFSPHPHPHPHPQYPPQPHYHNPYQMPPPPPPQQPPPPPLMFYGPPPPQIFQNPYAHVVPPPQSLIMHHPPNQYHGQHIILPQRQPYYQPAPPRRGHQQPQYHQQPQRPLVRKPVYQEPPREQKIVLTPSPPPPPPAPVPAPPQKKETDHITSGVMSLVEESEEEETTSQPSRTLSAIGQIVDAENQVYSFGSLLPTKEFSMWTETSKSDVEESLVDIVNRMKPYFKNNLEQLQGADLHGDELRQLFFKAFHDSFPDSYRTLLERVCNFEPGYLHVFDVLIGSDLEFGYKFNGCRTVDDCESSKVVFSSSESRKLFFDRIQEVYIPKLITLVPNKYISLKTFATIVQLVVDRFLFAADASHFSALNSLTKKEVEEFNVACAPLEMCFEIGKHWIRWKVPAAAPPNDLFEFVQLIEPAAADAVLLLPENEIVDSNRLFSVLQHVLGWDDKNDFLRYCWDSLIKDKEVRNVFFAILAPYLRIELRTGSMYFRRSAAEKPPVSVLPEYPGRLVSALKSEKQCIHRNVIFQMPPPTFYQHNDKFEKELLEELKTHSPSAVERVKLRKGTELRDLFETVLESVDKPTCSMILENAVRRLDGERWTASLKLQESLRELTATKMFHSRELVLLKSRLDTATAMEVSEVTTRLNGRILLLKTNVEELKKERATLVAEEVREEMAKVRKAWLTVKDRHDKEKKALRDEIEHLKDLLESRPSEPTPSPDVAEVTVHEEEEEEEDEENKEGTVHNAQLSCNEISSSESVYSEPFDDRVEVPSPVVLSPEARRQLTIHQKWLAEMNGEELKESARSLFSYYASLKTNHKERKTAAKQLKEYEEAIDRIKATVDENLKKIELNSLDALAPIPVLPLPFSDKVMQKVNEAKCALERIEPIVARRDSEDDEDSCLICFEAVTEQCPQLKCAVCTQKYHHPCVAQWLQQKSVCPACSRALTDPNEFPSLT